MQASGRFSAKLDMQNFGEQLARSGTVSWLAWPEAKVLDF
jgi:hypothetical protein